MVNGPSAEVVPHSIMRQNTIDQYRHLKSSSISATGTPDVAEYSHANMPSKKPGVVLTDFHKSLQSLFDHDRDNADTTLIVGNKRLKAHSFALTLRSRFFAGALLGGFRETATKEISLPSDNIFMIQRLLLHSYTLDYPGTPISIEGCNESSHISELYTHAAMYSLADKYGMTDLQTEALQKFIYTIQTMNSHSSEPSTVLGVMPLVYTGTPESDRGLRDAVAAFGAEHWGWFKLQPEVRDGAPPQFLFDVACELGRQVKADKMMNASLEAWRAYGKR